MIRLVILEPRAKQCRLDRQWKLFRDGTIECIAFSTNTPLDDDDDMEVVTRVGNVTHPEGEDDPLGQPLFANFDPAEERGGARGGPDQEGRERDRAAATSKKHSESMQHLNGLCQSAMGTMKRLSEAYNALPVERKADGAAGEGAPGEPSEAAKAPPHPTTTTPPPAFRLPGHQLSNSVAFATASYQVHCFETATGWRVILQTSNPVNLAAGPGPGTASSSASFGGSGAGLSQRLMSGLEAVLPASGLPGGGLCPPRTPAGDAGHPRPLDPLQHERLAPIDGVRGGGAPDRGAVPGQGVY